MTESQTKFTPKQRAYFDASSEVEEWEMALDVLRPWVESAKAIHFEKLTGVMERALAAAEEEAAGAEDRVRRAREAIHKP